MPRTSASRDLQRPPTDCGHRSDLIVSDAVAVELKAVDRLAPVLRLGGWKLGLLINFNVALLRNGIHGRVLGLEVADYYGTPQTAEPLETQSDPNSVSCGFGTIGNSAW